MERQNIDIEKDLFFEYCQNEEAESFKKLYFRVKPWLFNMIYRLVGNKHSAEDILQDTWTNVLANKSKFDFARGSFNNFIFTVARNEALQHVRKQSLKSKLINEINVNSSSPNVEEREKDIMCRTIAIHKALNKLPQNYKSVIIKYHFTDMSYEEIAIEDDLPIGTVKIWIYRGRKVLEQSLKNLFNDSE